MLYSAMLSFRNEGEIDFLKQKKQRKFITTRPPLQETL